MSRSLSRNAALRVLLKAKAAHPVAGVHSALSAKIAQEAGFPALFASGLGMSAQLGLRDANEASWTQVLDAVEHVVEATQVPVLVDADTGFGDFNNARRFAGKAEQRGASAVCLEDKRFPKVNSFLPNAAGALADVDEFCGRVKATKDAQLDSNFAVVARVEAFAVGLGLDEALMRANAYVEAGADAVLIHSTARTADQVCAFAAAFAGRAPLVIIPTSYGAQTPPARFQESEFSLIIWANQLLRAEVQAMQALAHALITGVPMVRVEETIAPLEAVFRLQRAEELERDRVRYESRSE